MTEKSALLLNIKKKFFKYIWHEPWEFPNVFVKGNKERKKKE